MLLSSAGPYFHHIISYFAAQFEGSLGRLTAASVHNPRQIIDVCRTVSPTGEESGKKSVSKELRRYRQLLMDIEKVCSHNELLFSMFNTLSLVVSALSLSV